MDFFKEKQNGGFDANDKGYLIKQSKIARVGVMDYLGSSLDQSDLDKNKTYQVSVEANELFGSNTIQSFEGMPVTLLHPEQDVDADNWKDLAVGHIQNVKEDGDFLVADVYITDSAAIKTIQNLNIKELSIGYKCNIEPSDQYDFKKTQIVGNHCAIVPSGRAGDLVRLGDRSIQRMSKKFLQKMGSLFASLSQQRLRDGSIGEEELTEAIAALNDALDALREAPDELEGKDEQITALEEQIADLEDKLLEIQGNKGSKPVGATSKKQPAMKDNSPRSKNDPEALITELEAENEQLKEENEELKKKIDELENEKGKASAINDATDKFPRVKLGRIKKARDVYAAVLADSGAFNKEELKTLSDVEIKAAYAAYSAVNGKKLNIGKTLLNDAANKSAKPASTRLGGK